MENKLQYIYSTKYKIKGNILLIHTAVSVDLINITLEVRPPKSMILSHEILEKVKLTYESMLIDVWLMGNGKTGWKETKDIFLGNENVLQLDKGVVTQADRLIFTLTYTTSIYAVHCMKNLLQ